MKNALLFALLFSSSLFAQSTTYVDKDGRNIGYSMQYGNYTTYTDKNGNTGYSYSDQQTTTYTGKDGRPANLSKAIPTPEPNHVNGSK